jgi:hypothetical protein
MQIQKLFKGGKSSREKTIQGNTVLLSSKGLHFERISIRIIVTGFVLDSVLSKELAKLRPIL